MKEFQLEFFTTDRKFQTPNISHEKLTPGNAFYIGEV